MKVTIAHLPSEELAAAAVEKFIRTAFPGVKVHKSDRHPPFKHIYLTTRIPGKPCDLKENP